MFSVNINLIPGYEVKIVKGNPSLKRYESAYNYNGQNSTFLTFESAEDFELNLVKNNMCVGIVTPGRTV